jgi:hypothetical protein
MVLAAYVFHYPDLDLLIERSGTDAQVRVLVSPVWVGTAVAVPCPVLRPADLD